LKQDAISKSLAKFDQLLIKQASTLLETIFNEPVHITVDETKVFDMEEVRNFISTQAIRVDFIITEKNKGFVYLANEALVPGLANYLRSEGKAASKVPDSMQLLLDVAEQLNVIKKQCFEEVLHKKVEFNNPNILLWNGKIELAFNDSLVTYYSAKIGNTTSFTFLRITPQLISNNYFNVVDLGDDQFEAQKGEFEEFGDSPTNVDAQQSIDFIHDLELLVTVELGRITMTLKDMLALGPGSIVELNKFAGEPVEVYVNNKKFAEGEVVVIDQNFAVRITSLVAKRDRFASLRA